MKDSIRLADQEPREVQIKLETPDQAEFVKETLEPFKSKDKTAEPENKPIKLFRLTKKDMIETVIQVVVSVLASLATLYYYGVL